MDTRAYNINLRNDYFNPVAVGLSQYDEGVVLAFSVYDGTDPAEFAAGTTAQIMGVRPSGVGFDVACTLTDNVVTVSTITDMTGESGIFPVEIRFYNSGVNVGTCNFIFAIEQAAHPDGTIDADITRQETFIERLEALETNTVTDPTLSISGRPADAAAAGAWIDAIATDSTKNVLIGAEWEKGSITVNGNNSNSNTRIRSKNFLPVYAYSTEFVITSGYQFAAVWYDATKAFLRDDYWHTGNKTLEPPSNAAYLRLVLRKTVEEAATLDYAEEITARQHYPLFDNVGYSAKFVKTLDNGSDLNDLSANGWYILTYSGTYSNVPDNAAGRRIVIVYGSATSTSLKHMFFANYTTGYYAHRIYADNAWMEWRSAAFQYIRTLSSGEDLDNLYNNGWYVIGATDTTIANTPETGATGQRILTIQAASNAPTASTYRLMTYVNVQTGFTAYRLYTSGAWGGWRNIEHCAPLTEGSDLNNLYGYSAVYTLALNGAFSNTPNEATGRRILEVISPIGTPYTVQRFTNITTQELYFRTYAGGAWSTWSNMSAENYQKEIAGAFTGIISASHGGIFTNSKYENSPLAFTSARKLGILYQDLDIVFTSDLVPVVSHSSFTDNAIRIADGDTSRINFRDYTLADLKSNYVFGDSNYSYTIQTLAEAYLYNRNMGCYICVDIGGGANNPAGSREALLQYMIANGIKCEYLVTSELDTFDIIKAASGAALYPLGIVIGSSTADSLATATEKINAIIAATDELNLKKSWCLVRRERMESGGDLVDQVPALKAAGVNIGLYSYDATTYSLDIPSFVDLVISAYVNVNYRRYVDAMA